VTSLGGPTAVGAASPSDERIESVLASVRARGGRVTTARRLLLSVLFRGDTHRTAEDLASEVQAIAPDVHLSTIYRNLDELEQLGVVVHAHLGHGPATYHLGSDTHGHLVCETCGSMTEAPADFFDALASNARAHHGFAIDHRHFAVLGQCQACQRVDGPPITGA